MLTESATDELVLQYLQNCKQQNEKYYSEMLIWGVRPNDIIKWMNSPVKYAHWNYEHIDKVEHAINQIAFYNLKEAPVIEPQYREDIILAKVLRNSLMVFDRSDFFSGQVNRIHVIQFLERDEIIYHWNNDFLLKVIADLNRVKEHLLK